MKRLLLSLLLAGCALQKEPNQQGRLLIRFDTPQNSPDAPQTPLPAFDSIEITVIGEFGVITAEGNIADGTFDLQVPPGPARLFQVIARDAENPVLLGSAVADIAPNIENTVDIKVRDAAGFTLSLLDSSLSALPLEVLQVSSLIDPLIDPLAVSEQFTLTPQGQTLLPLPIDVAYQLDNLPVGLRAPEGEGFLLLDEVGVPINQELVLLDKNDPTSIELSVEGLSLRLKVVNSLGLPVAVTGQISLIDEGGILSLPPLVSLSAADNGEALLTDVLAVVPGLFGVAGISAKLDDVGRSKGSLPVVLLDILPAGPPVALKILSASEVLEGLPRPEPGDVIIAAVDILGRVATSAQTTVTLEVSAGGRLRQGDNISEQLTVVLSQGIAHLQKGLLPTGSAASITVTATAAGLSASSVVVGVQ